MQLYLFLSLYLHFSSSVDLNKYVPKHFVTLKWSYLEYLGTNGLSENNYRHPTLQSKLIAIIYSGLPK